MHYGNSIRIIATAAAVVSSFILVAQVGAQPAAAVSKTAFDTATNSATATASGNTVRYVISVMPTNGAPSAIVVSDAIPSGTQYIAGSLKTPPSTVGKWSTDSGANYVSSEPGTASAVTNVRIEGASAIAQNGTVAPVPLPPAGSISGGSTGGDGWRVIPYNGKVYTVYHHWKNRPLYCADVATGAPCSGYPANIPATSGGAFTNASADGYFVTAGQFPEYVNRATGQLYVFAKNIATQKMVVVCANLNTQQSCGSYEFSSAPDVPAGDFFGMDGGVNGTQIYALTAATNQPTYACYDASSNAACAGTAADGTFAAGTGFPVAAGGGDYSTGQAIQIGTRFYGYVGTGSDRRINCFDMATNAQCGGNFPLNSSTLGPLFPTANASGAADGFCVAWDAAVNTTCYTLAGAAQTKANLSTALSTRKPEYTGGGGYAYGTALLYNGKTYWISDSTTPSQKFCWDWSTDALCAGFNTTLSASSGGAGDRFYEMTSDPDRPNCLWGLGDAGQIRSFDARDGSSCGGKTTVQVPASPAVSYCDGKAHTINWNQVQLFGLTSGTDFTSATLTIKDSLGNAVTGFNGITVSAFPVDISAIPYSGNNTSLTIFVELAGIPNPVPAAYSANPPPYLTTNWSGDSSQMCFDAKVLCAAAQPLENTASGTIGAIAVASTHSFSTVSKAACATLSGLVYLDRNGSGAYNTGASTVADDRNLTGVGLSLSCTNPTIGPLAATTTAAGYSFANVDPGASCTITESQPATYANGAQNPGNSITIASVPAGGSSGNNFGEVAGSVSGRVFNQTTGAGIGGQTINLTGSDANNNPLVGITVTTAPAGGLPAGTLCPSQPALLVGEYYICDAPLSDASGYTVTQPAQPAGTTNGTTTQGPAGGTPGNPTATSSQVVGVVISGATLAAPANNFGEAAIAVSDMVSSITCTPAGATSGPVTCNVTCTNNGPDAAADAFCSVPNASSLPGSPVPVCPGSPATSLAANGQLTCSVSFTIPVNSTVPISVQAGTGATNDVNGGTAPAGGNNPSVAVLAGAPPAAIPALAGAMLSLLALLVTGFGGLRARRKAGN
jgi:uncharacterized repeat protein (TIGR01451 family)